MQFIDQESIKGKIIYSLGMGTGILISLSNKRTSYKLTKALIKEIFGINTEKEKIKRDFYRLRIQKIISFKKIGDKHKIILTEKGKKIYLRFNYEKMTLPKKQIWDMKWRMILFDIPEKHKVARDSFRDKMKELGCVKFNNSVWLYPFSCGKEVDFIANYWNIGKYVHFAIVSKITNEDNLRKHFNI